MEMYLLTRLDAIKEAMIIHGYTAARNYYQSNDKLKQMPDKVVDYLDSILTTNKKEEGEN